MFDVNLWLETIETMVWFAGKERSRIKDGDRGFSLKFACLVYEQIFPLSVSYRFHWKPSVMGESKWLD